MQTINRFEPNPGVARGASARPGVITRLTMAALALALLLGMSVAVAAQTPIVSTQIGEIPTTGGMRPGPIGLNPPPVTRQRGVLPMAIQIEAAQVDAEIEEVEIVDGVMQDPTGPWVVSWYRETARLGELGNAVMAGHVDYWDVGAAVFYHLGDVQQGDEIRVIGMDGEVFTYAVEWTETVGVADLTTEKIGEIVGPTEAESLTLITCGGEFDYATGEYLSRMVVRAERV